MLLFMKNSIAYLLLIPVLFLSNVSCKRNAPQDYQLVIINATILNVKSGQTEANKTIFIDDGLIKEISNSSASDARLTNVIDARDKLLTPAFIDVHNHLNFIFGDRTEITNEIEFETYRNLISKEYLPYGVATVRSAGGRESNIPMEQSWMHNHPDYIDYYPTGGALVSLDTKFYNHIFVSDEFQVKSKIEEYYKTGIRHIKLYSLIGEKELESAIQTAEKFDMNIFGHIENSLISIETASNLGLNNFEHVKTLFLDVLRNYEKKSKDLSGLPPDDNENWRFREYEIFNFIGADNPQIMTIINLLKKNNASVTPTLHLYAHPLELTNIGIKSNTNNEDKLNWSEEKLSRARMGYQELAALVYKLYENGITLNTGTDTYEPGKALLSEMLLLNDLGIPIQEVFKIATINSATSIGLESRYGSIEVGKKAHLILFDKNPLEDPINLLENKMIIKDGIIWR